MGCASIAARSVIPAIKANPHYELVAIASRNQSKAEEFTRRFGGKPIAGYAQLLQEQLDAVYMPLPTGLHEEWVTAALNANLHVLAEKSFGMDAASTHRMTQLARQKQRVVAENFMFEHHSQQAFLRKLLEDGAIGEIRRFSASFGFPGLAPDNFRYDPLVGGGALLDAGAYTIKASQWLLGPQLRVLGSTLQYASPQQADVGGSALLANNRGIPAQLSWGFTHFYQCGYEIWGSKGKITTNRSFTAAPGFMPSLRLEQPNQIQEWQLPADDHFYNLLSWFAQCVQAGQVEPCALALDNQSQLLDAVRQAAQKP